MAYRKKCFSNFMSIVTDDDILRCCSQVRKDEPNLLLVWSSSIGSFWYQVAQTLARDCGGLTSLKSRDFITLATATRLRCRHSSKLQQAVADMFSGEASSHQITDSSETSVKLKETTPVDLRNEDVIKECGDKMQTAADFTEYIAVSDSVSLREISESLPDPLTVREAAAVDKSLNSESCTQRLSSSFSATLPTSGAVSSCQSVDFTKGQIHSTEATALVFQKEHVDNNSCRCQLNVVNCCKQISDISDTLSSKISKYFAENPFQLDEISPIDLKKKQVINDSSQSAGCESNIGAIVSVSSTLPSELTKDVAKDSFQSNEMSALDLRKEYVHGNSFESTLIDAQVNSFPKLSHKNSVLDINHPVNVILKSIDGSDLQSAYEGTSAPITSTSCPVFLNRSTCLSANECNDIIQKTSMQLFSSFPPLKPKNGDIFLFSNSNSIGDWKADQMGLRFFSRNFHPVPGGTLIKYKYSDQGRSKEQPATCEKFVFCLDSDPHNRYIIQYLGNPEAVALRPHGNAKTTNQSAAPRNFIATAPSVMKEIKENMDKSAGKIYSDLVLKRVPRGYEGVLKPRDKKQIRNVQYREREKSKISQDDMYAIVELYKLYGGFVLEFEIIHDFYCILANNDILLEVDSCCFESLAFFCCDTTFEFGDFYVTTLVFSHPSFTNAHIIPVFMMLHHKRTQATHDAFFEAVAKRFPAWNSARCKIVTDREKAITSAIDKYLPNITRLLCWNHIRRDVDAWVKKYIVPSGDDRRATIVSYSSAVTSLLYSTSEQEYCDNLEKFSADWHEKFRDYYTVHLQQDIEKHAGRWILERCSMFTDPSGITTNNSECFHSYLRTYMGGTESSLEHFVSKMYVMMSEFHADIQRGLHGSGDFKLRSHLIAKDPATLSLPDMPFTIENLSVIAQAKRAETKKTSDDIQRDLLPRLTRARALISTPGGVVLIPQQRIFTVKGYSGNVYTVRLHPKVSCSCPSVRKCDHIMACELAIGKEVVEDVKVGKLSALLKRKRGRSGRKFTTNSALTYVDDPDRNGTMPRVGILSSQIKPGYSARLAKQVSIVEVDAEVSVESKPPNACGERKVAVARGRPRKRNGLEMKLDSTTRQDACSSPSCKDFSEDDELPDIPHISSIVHSPSTTSAPETFVDLVEVGAEVYVESKPPNACGERKVAVARGRPRKRNVQQTKLDSTTRQGACSSPSCNAFTEDDVLPDRPNISSIGHSSSTTSTPEMFVDLCENDEEVHRMQSCSGVGLEHVQHLASSASDQPLVNSTPTENSANCKQRRLLKGKKSMFTDDDLKPVFKDDRTINGETMRHINLKTLAPMAWLDETVINSFLALQCHELVEEEAFLSMTYIPICRFKTFRQNVASPSPHFLQFLKTNNIWFHDIILVPIDLNSNHWLLALLIPKQRRIYYLDSLYPTADRQTVEALQVLVQILAYVSNDTCDITLWTFLKPQDTRKQRNGHACGVYVTMWAYIIAKSKILPVDDKQASFFRGFVHTQILGAEVKFVQIHKASAKGQSLPSVPESLMRSFLKGDAHKISIHSFNTTQFLADIKNTIAKGSYSCCFAKGDCKQPNTQDCSSVMNETVSGRTTTMVFCTYQCRDWYHKECEGISQAEIQATEFYKCRKCVRARQDAKESEVCFDGLSGLNKVILNPWKSVLKDTEAASSWLERNEDILYGTAVAPNINLLPEEEVNLLANVVNLYYRNKASPEQIDFMLENLNFKFNDERDKLLFGQIIVSKSKRNVFVSPHLSLF